MSAPEQMWREAIALSKMYPNGGAFYHEEGKPEIVNVVRYTRSDLIPNAAYVAGLEAALRIAGPIALKDYQNHPFVLLNAESECVSIIESTMAALSARPDAPDVRTVTVAQLESYYNAAAELGEIGICQEIRAIIGGTKE